MTMAELVDFLMKHKFSSFEKLEVLVSSLLQNLTIPSHLIKASNNLLYDVKYLILRIGDKLHSWESYGVHEVLNSLLWICPNPQTISLCSNAVGKYAKLYYCNLKVLKFKYFKPGEKGADKCSRCESLPVLCWQHYLQEVTIDSRGGEYEKTVKSFQRKRKARTKDDEIIKAFFENAREEEKILVHIIR